MVSHITGLRCHARKCFPALSAYRQCLFPMVDMPLREGANTVVTTALPIPICAYIYGFKQDWIINVPFVARVSMNNVLGTWRF